MRAGGRTPVLPRHLLEIDALLRELARARNGMALSLAAPAHVLVSQSAWTRFGYARADDFARELLGQSGSWLHNLSRLHAACGQHPELRQAVSGQDGSRPLGRVAALEIARIAKPHDVVDWIARARAMPVRELKRAVRGALSKQGRRVDAESDDDTLRVRLRVPRAVRAAFEEAADLHRAVCGREESLGSFVEALTGEATASGVAGLIRDVAVYDAPRKASGLRRDVYIARDADTRVDPRRADEAHPVQRSASASRSTAYDARTPCDAVHSSDEAPPHHAMPGASNTVRHPVVVEALAVLESHRRRSRFDARLLARSTAAPRARLTRGEKADLERVLESLQQWLALENQIEVQMGRLLALLSELRAWDTLGFAGVGHYGEERLSLSRSSARARAQLARRLHHRRAVAHAYSTGKIGSEAASTIDRILRTADERKNPRAGPMDRAGGLAAELTWVERACESTVKRIRDECRILRERSLADASPHRAPMPLEDVDWHAALLRRPGRSLERVAAYGHRMLGDVLRGPERPTPDVCIELNLPVDEGRAFVEALESLRVHLCDEAAREVQRSRSPAEEARLRPSQRIARELRRRRWSVPAWVAILAMLEDYVCTWDTKHARRADAEYSRDGWRCMAPGCTSRYPLERHHVVYRSRGGSDESDNLVVLCRFHHQMGEHGGLAQVRGRAPLDLVWRLGHVDLARWYRNERTVTGATN